MTPPPTGRTSPELFLKLIEKSRRGKLKLYIGHAAGVGKTYQMLEDGHMARARGVDVVVGYVETHGRQETHSKIGDLEVLPRRRPFVLIPITELRETYETGLLVERDFHTAPYCRPGERRDPYRPWAPAFAGVTSLQIMSLQAHVLMDDPVVGAQLRSRGVVTDHSLL